MWWICSRLLCIWQAHWSFYIHALYLIETTFCRCTCQEYHAESTTAQMYVDVDCRCNSIQEQNNKSYIAIHVLFNKQNVEISSITSQYTFWSNRDNKDLILVSTNKYISKHIAKGYFSINIALLFWKLQWSRILFGSNFFI